MRLSSPIRRRNCDARRRPYSIIRRMLIGHVSTVSAQPVVAPPAPVVGAPDVLDVGPDEEVLVREYVIRRRPAPAPVVVAPPPVVTAPAPVVSEPLAIVRPGSIIPADVELNRLSMRRSPPCAAIPTSYPPPTKSWWSSRWGVEWCAYSNIRGALNASGRVNVWGARNASPLRCTRGWKMRHAATRRGRQRAAWKALMRGAAILPRPRYNASGKSRGDRRHQ
jgi:hypothetical protein